MKLSPEAKQLITDHYRLTLALARNRARSLDRRWNDDLVSAGLEALVLSATRWDGTKGVSFDYYLRIRIPGAVLDEWRRITQSRSDRHLLPKSLDAMREEAGNRPGFDIADPDPSPEAVLLTRERVRKLATTPRTDRERAVLLDGCFGTRGFASIAREWGVDSGTISHDIARMRAAMDAR